MSVRGTQYLIPGAVQTNVRIAVRKLCNVHIYVCAQIMHGHVHVRADTLHGTENTEIKCSMYVSIYSKITITYHICMFNVPVHCGMEDNNTLYLGIYVVSRIVNSGVCTLIYVIVRFIYTADIMEVMFAMLM
jgi:hypothetical protein